MIKACIFDMDGTILDSMGYWKECGEIFVKKNGKIPEPNLAQKIFEYSLNDGCAYLQKNYFQDSSIQFVIGGVLEIMKNFYQNEIVLKKGAQRLLEFLCENKIPCVLATATPKKLFLPALERLQIAKYFSFLFDCHELNTHKTEPKIYLAASSALGFLPKECLVFEDALVPIRTAKMAGFKTCGVYDKTSNNETSEIKKYSDFYLESLEDFSKNNFFS